MISLGSLPCSPLSSKMRKPELELQRASSFPPIDHARCSTAFLLDQYLTQYHNRQPSSPYSLLSPSPRLRCFLSHRCVALRCVNTTTPTSSSSRLPRLNLLRSFRRDSRIRLATSGWRSWHALLLSLCQRAGARLGNPPRRDQA